jgi:S-adenosylmethionine/arginine decarboxylase-like enzyme
MIKSVWGYALSLDIGRCNPKLIRCPLHIATFSNTLVKRIDMEAYGPPQVVLFGEGNKKGYTLTQLITTSNITGHFCEQDNAAFLDIFSCKPYKIEDAVNCVREFFEPELVVRHYIERSIPKLK